MKKQQCYIFDIDGTLADHHGIRNAYDESKVSLDKPIIPVANVLKALQRDGWNIIFVSGRTEKAREDTEKWIKQEIFHVHKLRQPFYRIQLFMRNAKDHRNDAIVKKEIYDNLILPRYEIMGVFDDRMRVCQMLYENNFFCFNVNQGLKEY